MAFSNLNLEIFKLIDHTSIVDTHEHLLEEKSRLTPGDAWRLNDIGILFSHYADHDLRVAGMSQEDLTKILALSTEPEEKWRLLKPFWPFLRTTGYGRCVVETLKEVFDADDLTETTWKHVNDDIAKQIKPGFYKHILKEIACIDHCQVNSLEGSIICETDQPELLLQDLSTVGFCIDLSLEGVKATSGQTGVDVKDLNDWCQVVDWYFAKYGPMAVATKNQGAYTRGLDFEPVTHETAEPVFTKFLNGDPLTKQDMKPIEDFLSHYCIDKATEYHLPVKLHTGYYAGQDWMPMGRVQGNPGQMSDLCMAHPDARFVFMHITYPYQSEAIAVAKHFSNAWIDMCWAWIINPVASVRFLKEFLTAAPNNKIFTFGGDFAPVELVAGHAAIARRGITQALAELVNEGWIDRSEVPFVIERLMRQNALDFFDVDRCKKA
jgi:uncharacterized protein